MLPAGVSNPSITATFSNLETHHEPQTRIPAAPHVAVLPEVPRPSLHSTRHRNRKGCAILRKAGTGARHRLRHVHQHRQTLANGLGCLSRSTTEPRQGPAMAPFSWLAVLCPRDTKRSSHSNGSRPLAPLVYVTDNGRPQDRPQAAPAAEQ